MKILLDSHAFVWFLTGNPRCSMQAREAIEASDATVFVSAASAWEIATKVRAGKWPEAAEVARDMSQAMADHDFTPLAVTIEHGRVAGFLAGDHRDPFDRMLAAQALVEDVQLVSADPLFRDFQVRVIW